MTQTTQSTKSTDPLSELLALVRQMSNRLEAIAAQNAPDWQLPLKAYKSQWPDRIGAIVLESDDHGPSKVVWCGHTYTRRTGAPKYGPQIWFSRGLGNDEYARLITFGDTSPAEALPAHVLKELSK
jgi:hypothetical protein